MITFSLTLADAFEQLVYDFEQDMYQNNCEFAKEDVVITCPDFVRDWIAESFFKKYMFPFQGKDFKYQGVPFTPTYHMEIAIFYRHYPLYKKEYMLKKIDLNNFTVKNAVISQHDHD